MLRRNGRIFSYLFIAVILNSCFDGVLVDCSDSTKRIHRRNSVAKKYVKDSQNEVISTRKLPEISEKRFAKTSEFERTYSKSGPYKKMVSRNFRVQESVPVFLPSLSNGISKEITLNNKGPKSRPRKQFIAKSSAKIPSKRLESIPYFFSSFPDDISKQTLQIPKVPSFALKASKKGQENSMCQHKLVLRNVRFKHGRKLATFELRGRVPSIAKCVEKCCKRHWCNVAYKVAGYCYSVHCPTDEACESVKSEDVGILSDYVLLDRPHNMNYKRNSIPGTVTGQDEKKITLQLNITNEKFRAPLADWESLDFLNVAERVENAISNLLKASVGFKGCEVISFRPTPLIVNVTLKLSKDSPANDSGSLLLQAARDGKMDSTLEDASEHFKLSQVGFEMNSSSGESLVCHSEADYQNRWGLTMFGALDRQHCPRNAQGECSRRCLGSENEKVKWDVPDFSGCTSLEFRDLHEKAKQFKSHAQAKLPLDQIEAKTGIKHVEVLKKLQKLTYHHTFRKHFVKQKDGNKTKNINPRLHDSHKLKVHQLKTTKKRKLMRKTESEIKPNPAPQGLLSLTNQLLNIKEKPQEELSINQKKSGKNHTLSIADKIGLLQPNALLSSEPARPGSYHVLNQHDSGLSQHVSSLIQHETPLQHETRPIQHEAHPIQHVSGSVQQKTPSVQHETRPIQHETHPIQHVSGAVQHATFPVEHETPVQNETRQKQHVLLPVQHVSNPLQRDPHPVLEKGQNRNDIAVSVSVSGDFSEPVTNGTDLSDVFLKSGPENIRSRIPTPDSRSGRIPSTNLPVQGRSYGDRNIAPSKDGNIPRTDPRGMSTFKSKSKHPKAISNTLLNWLNGAVQKYDNNPSYSQQKSYQTDVSSSLSNSLHSPRYNGGSLLGETRRRMDHSGTLLNGQSNNMMPGSPYNGRAISKRSVAYKSFTKSLKHGIRSKRQAWDEDRNYLTTSDYNSDPRHPSTGYSGPSTVEQDRQGYPSTLQRPGGDGSQKTSNNAITGNPVNSKNAYFTGIDDDDQDLQPVDVKSSDNNALPEHNTPPSSGSSNSNLLTAPSLPKSNTLPVQIPASSSPSSPSSLVGAPPPPSLLSSSNLVGAPPPQIPASSSPSSPSSLVGAPPPPSLLSSSNLVGAPPPPSFLSSYEDNPPPRPLSPLRSSPQSQPHPPPISPPTFDDSNPPHRPLSPPASPGAYSSFRDSPSSSPTSSYVPSPPDTPMSAPYHPPTSSSVPSFNSPPPPSLPYNARPPPVYNPAPYPAPPPSYSPVPPTSRPPTRPSYNFAPTAQAYSQPPSTPGTNSNSAYGSYSATSSPTYQGANPAYNSSSYPEQSNSNSTYDSHLSSSESYYTSPSTYQESNPQYNSSNYLTQTSPNSTYDSFTPTSQPTYQEANSPNNASTYLTEGANAGYNSSDYLAPLNPNPTDSPYSNTPNKDSSNLTNFFFTNEMNNNEYTYNNTASSDQRTANDFNMQNIGEPLNDHVTNDSWNKLLSDYNMTTQPLSTNSADSEYNNINNSDYNVTFEHISSNLSTESPAPRTSTSSQASDISLQKSLYKDLGDSQTVVGFIKPSSMQANVSSSDVQELGTILNGIHSPRLTIEDMKKRIKEFSSGYNDKQANGQKKTLAEQDNESDEDILVKGKHIAPMFGGDLLLAADTVKHLAKFNDFIRPPIVLDDLKEFLKSCSNILDTTNSREWKNAQRHVAKLSKFGVNIMSDSNAVDWEQASRRTVAGAKNPSTLYEMVEAIESFGLSASYQVKKPIKEPIITKNIVMELRTIQSDIQEPSPDIMFPNITDPRIRNWTKESNIISLSPAALDEVAQGANVEAHVSGVLFKTVGNLSIPVEEGPGNETIESGNLMSMSVYPKITGDLDPPIRIALAHLNPEMSHFKQDCVFLNASASGGEIWSNKGCKVADVNDTHTTCECNHMSSFSLLVDKSKPNDFVSKTTPVSTGEGGAGSGGSSSSGFVYIALLFFLILAVILIIIFAVWRKRKGKSKDEKGGETAKSSNGGDENKAGTSGSATEGVRGQSSQSSSSGDKKKRKRGEGRKDGRKKKSKKPHTLDKDAITEENQQDSESKPEDRRASKKRQQQKEREERLLMKEKAMIFSDYRQPYNFLAHEEAAPDPLDSSTPLPTTSKADSYPRRHKRPTSFQEPMPGQPGFNLRKHNSESNFPMQALHRRWGLDSPRDRRGSPQRQGSVLEGSIREEPLEEQRQAEDTREADTPRGTSTPSEVVQAKSKKKFWKRKSKENLNLETVQEGDPVEQESPKKKKKIFGKKNRSASRTSLSASQESLGASSEQNEPERLESKPPISPTKKKKFWQRKKSSSQASLDATSPRPAESGGISDEGLQSDDDGLVATPEKRGSILRRLSKSGSRTSLSGSRTSLSKSGSRSSLSKSEESLQGEQASTEGSPKKRRSSLLGKLSRSGSKSSLNKSQSSIEGLADEDTGKSPKRKSSLLRKLSKSRSSLSKSEDSLEGDPGVTDDGSKESRTAGEDGAKTSRKPSVLRKLSKSSKSGSRRSSKSENIPSGSGTAEGKVQTVVQPGGADEKLSQSGSTLSLSKGDIEGESSTLRKKKGLFGKKKSSSRTSLNKDEGANL